jgi:hypothetical protein
VTFKGFEYRRFKKFGKRPKSFKVLKPFGDDVEQVDTVLTEITNALGGDEKTAKRVRQLQLQFGGKSSGTLPELVTMDWLDQNKIKYIFQGRVFGGRAAAGGLLPDFVVDTGGGRGAVWNVQGEYWHNRSAQKGFDDASANLRYLGQVVGGIRIEKVLLLNERDILRRRPFVFQMALAGIALN